MADRWWVRPKQPVRQLVELLVVEEARGAEIGDELRRAPVPPRFGAQQHGAVDGACGILPVVAHEQLDRLPVPGTPAAHLAPHQQSVQIRHGRGGPQLVEAIGGNVVHHDASPYRASCRLMSAWSKGRTGGSPVSASQSSTGASPRPASQDG
jgi:hypothetical protein